MKQDYVTTTKLEKLDDNNNNFDTENKFLNNNNNFDTENKFLNLNCMLSQNKTRC